MFKSIETIMVSVSDRRIELVGYAAAIKAPVSFDGSNYSLSSLCLAFRNPRLFPPFLTRAFSNFIVL